MTAEDRLREAIQARTSEVEPSPPSESLRRIEQKLAEARRSSARRRLLAGVGSAAAAALAVVALVATLSGDDDQNVRTADDRTTTSSPSTTSSTSTTSTTEPSTTSSAPSTTTTTTEPTTSTSTAPSDAGVDPAVPIWPRTQDSLRFDDPVEAAQSFAVDFVGFTDPIVGTFQAGDDRSGEVVVRPTAEGPGTVVLVRQLEDDTWFVVASATGDITLDRPATGAQVTCPLRLTGTALAFEGTVEVALLDDRSSELGSGFVTGGGDEARPFDDTIDCSLASGGATQHGTIVLTTTSAEDGRIWQAVTRRVALRR